jgi:hypothetical protein
MNSEVSTPAVVPSVRSDWQLRVIYEKAELDKRIVALEDFLTIADANDESWPPKGLTSREYQRLHDQLRVMAKYSSILGQRILHFK